MKRAKIVSEKRKIQMKQYYLTKIKPHRALKQPVYLWKCPFCGMLGFPHNLSKKTFETKVYARFGRNYINPLTQKDKSIVELFLQKTENFYREMLMKAILFLSIGIKKGWITKEDIIKLLGLEEARYREEFEPLSSRIYRPEASTELKPTYRTISKKIKTSQVFKPAYEENVTN